MDPRRRNPTRAARIAAPTPLPPPRRNPSRAARTAAAPPPASPRRNASRAARTAAAPLPATAPSPGADPALRDSAPAPPFSPPALAVAPAPPDSAPAPVAAPTPPASPTAPGNALAPPDSAAAADGDIHAVFFDKGPIGTLKDGSSDEHVEAPERMNSICKQLESDGLLNRKASRATRTAVAPLPATDPAPGAGPTLLDSVPAPSPSLSAPTVTDDPLDSAPAPGAALTTSASRPAPGAAPPDSAAPADGDSDTHAVLSNKVCIIYDERMMKHVSRKKHMEAPKRIDSIFKQLEIDGLLIRCTIYASEHAKLSFVTNVHTDSYVRRIIKGNIKRTGNADMYFCKGSEDSIFLAAGGAVKACELVATGRHEHGFAIVRPPGHHAGPDSESGFCFFNNVAIAAKYLAKEHNMKKILVLDWDVHFGNGTYEIFKTDNSVLFISMHMNNIFPESEDNIEENIGIGEGKGYTCNICWDKPVNDDDLYAVMDYLVVPLAEDFVPDVILLSAGFDAALDDIVDGCYISELGYATSVNKLLQLKKSMILILEGGYNLDVLGRCCSSCIKVLTGDTSEIKGTIQYSPLQSTLDSVLKLKKLLLPFHPGLKSDIPDHVLARATLDHPDPREVT